MQKILSICIPTYNRKSWLQRSINKLVERLDERVEIIISDNCSPDDTQSYCEELIAKYPTITYHRQDKNIGPDGNFLWCLNNATGKYVQLLADDDYMQADMVTKLADHLEKSNLALAIINSKSIKNDVLATDAIYGNGENSYYDATSIDEFISAVGVQITFVSALIFNKELIDKIQDKEQYNKTFFLQAHLALRCLGYSKEVAIFRDVLCVAENDNSSGYNIYKVFMEKWHEVLFTTARESGISKKCIKAVFDKTIRGFIVPFLIKERLDNGLVFDTKGKWRYFSKVWCYKSAWTRLYPVALAPKALLRKVANRRNINVE